MTAKQKFEARLKELGLYEEWVKQGECGRVAVEREDGIILLVHESDKDRFTEEHFPTFSELRKNPKFVEECKEEWYTDWDDDRFVRNLACWLDGYSDECPLFPVDVYFPGNQMMTEWKDFEDDENDDEEEYQSQLENNKTQISLMQSFLKLYRNQLCGMILSELRRGHNLVGRFDPYPGWDSHHLCGYEIANKTMVVEEMADGCMVLALYQEGYDTKRLPLSASDFPIEVLLNIYEAMK